MNLRDHILNSSNLARLQKLIELGRKSKLDILEDEDRKWFLETLRPILYVVDKDIREEVLENVEFNMDVPSQELLHIVLNFNNIDKINTLRVLAKKIYLQDLLNNKDIEFVMEILITLRKELLGRF